MKILLCFLYSFLSLACTFHGAETLFIYGPSKSTAINTENCNNSQIEALQNLLGESVGTLDSNHLKRFNETADIKIIPELIKIRNLDDMITARLSLSDEMKAVVVDQTISDTFLTLNEGEFFEIHCNDCNTNGLKNVKIVKNISGIKETHWIKTKILSAVTVVVANSDFPLNFNSTNLDNLSIQTQYVLNPLDYVTDKNQLVFNRFNKLIKKNDIIKKSDITPLSMVTYGVPVNVKMNSKNLNVSASAVPLSNGFIGDYIKLKNSKTNHIFTAKITGKNEVRIDL